MTSTAENAARITVEDCLGDFGFRVRWSVQNHWADVEVFKVAARVDDEGGIAEFLQADWTNSDQLVRDINQAEHYLSGFIKWDGCSELDQGCPHWCGPRDYQLHCDLLRYLYARAFELMGREPEEPWLAPLQADADDLYIRLESLSKSLEACDRIDALEDRDAYPTILNAMNFVGNAEQEIAAIKARLPVEMQHCTILFKECEKGHGWLTTTNWVQHGCPTCAINELRESLAYAISEADAWLYECWGKEKVRGPEMDKARSLATAASTPPRSPPPTQTTAPAAPGSTPPADQ